jgi:hypothetical protein
VGALSTAVSQPTFSRDAVYSLVAAHLRGTYKSTRRPLNFKNSKSASLYDYDYDPSAHLVVFHDVLAVVWVRLSILGDGSRGIAREIKLYSCGLGARQWQRFARASSVLPSIY